MNTRIMNRLLNKYKLNSIRNSVFLSDLIKQRVYNDYDDFRAEVNKGLQDNPNCRVKYRGKYCKINNLVDLGKVLYLACKREGEEIDITECIEYVDNLFVIKTINGFQKEELILEYLRHQNPTIRKATPKEDALYAVDLVVPDICGYQVKPITYKYYNHQEDLNIDKNKKFGLPVFYVYYHKDNKLTIEKVT